MGKTAEIRRTLVQQEITRIIKDLIERVAILSGPNLTHTLTKGQLREIFVSDILKKFLPNHFGIGSGIIINQRGGQSKQTDILIYDNRILVPFIKEQNIGIYPAESVIATIEVKSWLRKKDLLKAEENAMHLYKTVYVKEGFVKNYHQYVDYIRPLCAVIGFYGSGARELSKEGSGKLWLRNVIKYLFGICLVNKYSWLYIGEPSWRYKAYEKETNEETKRFIAVLLDNIRTKSEIRLKNLSIKIHKDWLSIYMRDQKALFQD